MTAMQIVINAENGLDAATQIRNFVVGLQLNNPIPSEEQAKAGVVGDKKPAAPKKAAKPVIDEEEEDDTPAPKKAVKKPAKPAVDEDEEEDEEPAPKKAAPKKAAKPAPADDDEDEEEEAPKAKGKAAKTDGKSSVGELKDDGKEQPATVDGCRIMVRRVARAHDTDYAQAVLAEFGVDGATKVPPKKMASFIERCQEVIDDPESIELAE